MSALAVHKDQFADVYAGGALQPEIHHDLVTELSVICERANVLPHYVSTRMASVCSQKEIEWIRDLPQHVAHGILGLALVGQDHVERRMASMCGALLRNFIDARVCAVQDLFDSKIPEPDNRVLFIPNFHLGKEAGGNIATWQSTALYGALLHRIGSGKLTVVGVDSLEGMAAQYGSVFRELIDAHYSIL